MIFGKWKDRVEKNRYEQCKELANHPEFEYDVDIMLFISSYEILQDPRPRKS